MLIIITSINGDLIIIIIIIIVIIVIIIIIITSINGDLWDVRWVLCSSRRSCQHGCGRGGAHHHYHQHHQWERKILIYIIGIILIDDCQHGC